MKKIIQLIQEVELKITSIENILEKRLSKKQQMELDRQKEEQKEERRLARIAAAERRIANMTPEQKKIQNEKMAIKQRNKEFDKIKRPLINKLISYLRAKGDSHIYANIQKAKTLKPWLIDNILQYYKDRYGDDYLEKTNYNDVLNHFDATAHNTYDFLQDNVLKLKPNDPVDNTSFIDLEKQKKLITGGGRYSGVANGSGRGVNSRFIQR